MKKFINKIKEYYSAENKATLHISKSLEKLAREDDAFAFIIDQVRKDGLKLAFVPEEYKTPELCEVAVQQNGDALQYVPEEYKIEIENIVFNEIKTEVEDELQDYYLQEEEDYELEF